MQFSIEARKEYIRLWESCVVGLSKAMLDKQIERISKNIDRYQSVSESTKIPWFFIAIIHLLEGNLDFKTHLHNGDPLSARTVNEPKGRPKQGMPPFTWEFSAKDALEIEGICGKNDWSIPSILYRLEAYNGFGYRKSTININTPYLWSGTNHYVKGKYVADGKYDAEAVSKQIGAVPILKRFLERKLISVDPMMEQMAVKFAPGKKNEAGEKLQRMLNEVEGVSVGVDGFVGPQSAEAFYRVSGSFLEGDPKKPAGVA